MNEKLRDRPSVNFWWPLVGVMTSRLGTCGLYFNWHISCFDLRCLIFSNFFHVWQFLFNLCSLNQINYWIKTDLGLNWFQGLTPWMCCLFEIRTSYRGKRGTLRWTCWSWTTAGGPFSVRLVRLSCAKTSRCSVRHLRGTWTAWTASSRWTDTLHTDKSTCLTLGVSLPVCVVLQNLERDLLDAERQSAQVRRVHLQHLERLWAQQDKRLMFLQQQWEDCMQHISFRFDSDR